MAPRNNESTPGIFSSNAGPMSPNFVNKLGDWQFFTSMWHYLQDSKESMVVGTGVSVMEKGAQIIALPIRTAAFKWAGHHPDAASLINDIACTTLDTIEGTVPAIKTPANEVIVTICTKTSTKTRRALRTFPGRQLINVINFLLDVSETIIDIVAPEEKAQKEVTRTKKKDGKMEIAEVKDKERKIVLPNLPIPVPQTAKYLMVMALIKWVRALKFTRRWVSTRLNIRHHKMQMKLRSMKLASFERRKITPKKYLLRSFPARFIFNILDQFGYTMTIKKKSKEGDIRLYLVPSDVVKSALNMPGHHEKRKHDVICSDESDLDLDVLHNLDDYNSADDPDFQPGDAFSTDDSYESVEGATESDLSEGEEDLEELKKKLKAYPLKDFLNEEDKSKDQEIQATQITEKQRTQTDLTPRDNVDQKKPEVVTDVKTKEPTDKTKVSKEAGSKKVQTPQKAMGIIASKIANNLLTIY